MTDLPAADSRTGRLLWPATAVVVTILLALSRLIRDRSFFFADDSQLGSLGQWYHLAEALLSGRLPVLDPAAWQAGNYAAEGQWGLLSPATWLIALFVHGVDDPVLSVTVVKVAFLAAMALGVHLLARSFGASPAWAALAGVLVPLGGFTVFMDAPSWATGLFNVAVLPWAWWGLRRTVEDRRGPVPYLLASFTLITFGYVFGVLVFVMVLCESLVRSIVRRRRAGIVANVLASAWGALVTIPVYLPGILTSSVTVRTGFDVFNVGFLNLDLTDLGSAASPTAVGSVGAWWGNATAAPLPYIAWAIPLLPLFLPVARATVLRMLPLLVVGGLNLLLVLGPSHIGPLRWPVRMMPYLVLCVVVVLTVCASTRLRVPSRSSLWASFLVLGAMGYLAVANAPQGWRSLVLVGVVQAAAIFCVWWLLADRPLPRALEHRRTTLAVVGSILMTAVLVLPQARLFPSTPLPQNAVPRSLAQLQQTLADGVGEGIAVGDGYAGSGDEHSFAERLIANLWYLSPVPVSSLYTVLPHAAYSEDLCADLRGSTCAEALDTLFEVDHTTGERVVDLMGVSTVVVMKATFPDEPPIDAPGWRVEDAGDRTWLLTRASAVPGAGGVAWTGSGTAVEVTAQSDTTVSFRVDAVGEDARVVLSRLVYPGYTVDGAAQADPVRGWLLTVDVTDAAVGEVVTVSFRPPGFALETVSLGLALLVGVGWVVLTVRVGRARRLNLAAGA